MSQPATKRKFIPEGIYNKHIMPNMIIACGDAIVTTPRGVLLGRRLNPPMQGELWFPGGRLHKGEEIEKSIITNVKNETGLLVAVVPGLFPIIGDTLFTVGQDRHSINTTLVVKSTGGTLCLGADITDPQFITTIEPGLHPYIKEVLNRSGIFNQELQETILNGGVVSFHHQLPGIVRYDETDPKVAHVQIQRLMRVNPEAAKTEQEKLRLLIRKL